MTIKLNKTKNIYILGEGFVGTNLYQALIQDKYTNVHLIGRNQVDFMNADHVDNFFNQQPPIDFIFITASKVGGIQANIKEPFEFLYNNLMIQNNIIQCCLAYDIRNMIFLASSCMYPKDWKQPLREEYLLEGKLENTNEGYALSKICGLKLCEAANREYGSRFLTVIPPNLYGPGNIFDETKSHVLQSLIKKIYDAKMNNQHSVEIWGSGIAKREFLYIDDLTNGLIWIMENSHNIPYDYLNIGMGNDVSIKDLAYFIKEIIGYKGEFIFNKDKPEGMMKKCLDISKINKSGWIAKTSLEEGLRKTIEYYEKTK